MKWLLVVVFVNINAASAPAILRVEMTSEAACAEAIKAISAGMSVVHSSATCIGGVK